MAPRIWALLCPTAMTTSKLPRPQEVRVLRERRRDGLRACDVRAVANGHCSCTGHTCRHPSASSPTRGGVLGGARPIVVASWAALPGRRAAPAYRSNEPPGGQCRAHSTPRARRAARAASSAAFAAGRRAARSDAVGAGNTAGRAAGCYSQPPAASWASKTSSPNGASSGLYRSRRPARRRSDPSRRAQRARRPTPQRARASAAGVAAGRLTGRRPPGAPPARRPSCRARADRDRRDGAGRRRCSTAASSNR